MVRKIISVTLAAIMLASLLASCAAQFDLSATSSEGAVSKYRTYLAERLGAEMPRELVIATADEATAYGVDLSDYQSDGYYIRAEGGEVLILAKSDAGLDRAVRKYAKDGDADSCLFTYGEGYRVKRLTIAGTDISEYTIVIPDDADDCVKYSADTLAKYVGLSCGAKLGILTQTQLENIKCGEGAKCVVAHKIFITGGDESLGDEGFTITVAEDGTLSIKGGKWRGALFGVYDLLEDIGWRFPGAAFITEDSREFLFESESIDLTAELNRTEIPDVAIRGGTGVLGNKDTYSTMGKAKLGGYGFPQRSCHGLANNHDKIFSGEYEGLYLGWDKTGYQPCFTDEYILEAIEAYVTDYVQSRLDAKQEIGKEIVDVDIAQWDSGPGDFCRCKSCTAVLKEEGSDSGAVVRMANRMAAVMDENNWDVTVSILAYYGTDILPKITRPVHNVLVSYCFFAGNGYEACSNHCISGADCDRSNNVNNVVPAERFEKWVEAMDPKNIQVWYYPLNWRKIAYNSPIYTVLLEDMKYLASKGVGHVYLCHSSPADGVVNVELSKYLCGRYLWDSSITEEESLEMIREWFTVVYGAAGDYLYQCAMLSERAGDLAGCWGVLAGVNDHIDYKFMARHGDEVWKYYKEAVAAAETAEKQRIIENYMAGVLYTVVVGGYEDMYVNGSAAERETLCKWYSELFRIFRDNHLPIVANVYNVGETGRYLTGEVDFGVDPHTWMDAEKNGE